MRVSKGEVDAATTSNNGRVETLVNMLKLKAASGSSRNRNASPRDDAIIFAQDLAALLLT
jgi:hypothetical protein